MPGSWQYHLKRSQFIFQKSVRPLLFLCRVTLHCLRVWHSECVFVFFLIITSFIEVHCVRTVEHLIAVQIWLLPRGTDMTNSTGGIAALFIQPWCGSWDVTPPCRDEYLAHFNCLPNSCLYVWKKSVVCTELKGLCALAKLRFICTMVGGGSHSVVASALMMLMRTTLQVCPRFFGPTLSGHERKFPLPLCTGCPIVFDMLGHF